MLLSRRLLLVAVPVCLPLTMAADAKKKAAPASIAAVVETTLATEGEHIRQLAFDGDAESFFVSKNNPGAADHFTLVFDNPVAVQSIVVTTGKPDGGGGLDAGRLEVSATGKRFDSLATFADGRASAKPQGRRIQAIRIRPTVDMKHPLAIREIVVESKPAVAIFRYPVEFIVDTSDAPQMKKWTETAARICERQYAMINEELASDGYKPRRRVWMTMKKDHTRNVAEVSRDRITGSASYFKSHPDDFGAMVHETVHVVQDYRLPGNPGWLVEGIADYIRFFKYEPGKLGRIDVSRAHYNSSYRVTAAFLAYLTAKYDRQLVNKLNKMMREGEYREEAFKALTGKTVQQLDTEWRATLGRNDG